MQIKEKLLISTVSEDVKSRLLNEIAKESGHRFELLRLEYTPENEKQVFFGCCCYFCIKNNRFWFFFGFIILELV